MLRAAALIEKNLNLPSQEAKQEKEADSQQSRAAQPGGEHNELKNHSTASPSGPDGPCETGELRRSKILPPP